MNHATFTFHPSLKFFLPRVKRRGPFQHTFEHRTSIKDMVESFGVPHPEIGLLVVNGESVDFGYMMADGDDVVVHGCEHDADVQPQVALRPPREGRTRFILDTHLGRLAAYLRMAGFDTLYRNDYPDDELARVAHDENRVLLTRDVGLLKRSLVTHGYFVRETKPRKRIIEVMRRYDLADEVQPFARCTKCNGLLNAVDKATVADDLPPRTAEYFDAFYQCEACAQVYWPGSHYEKMQALLAEVMET